MENQTNSNFQINFRSVFITVFKAKWIILFSSTILATLIFLYTTITSSTYYVASTEIYIMDNTVYSASMNYSDFQAAQFLTRDYEQLISNPTVLTPVIDKLDLKISPNALKRNVIVTAKEDTRIISISVKNSDPYLATEIANTIREVASEKIVSTMGIDAVNTINKAQYPVAKQGVGSINPAILTFVFCIIISIGIILILDMFNDTIKTPDEIVEKLGLSTLGSIPYDPEIKKQLSKEGAKK